MTVTTLSYTDLISEDLYIGGWREGTSERTAQTTNPFNDETIATIRQASKQDVDDAYEIARAAQVKWATLPPKKAR